MTRVVVLFEEIVEGKGDSLCLQFCRYCYDDGTTDTAYRVIRRSREGNLKAQRGQAGIPDLNTLKSLVDKAEKAGWGSYQGTMTIV